MAARLLYFHDPMCSWCWGFAPVWRQVRDNLPVHITLENIVGGLAPDSNAPMPTELQKKLQTIWERIQNTIPGTEFNFDFWTECLPRRSTYPACRAVLAAKSLEPSKEQAIISAIQHAYYLQAKNPSDLDVLQECAVSVGLDEERFIKRMKSVQIEQQLQNQISCYQKYSNGGFPSLVLKSDTKHQQIVINYNDASSILAQMNASRE